MFKVHAALCFGLVTGLAAGQEGAPAASAPVAGPAPAPVKIVLLDPGAEPREPIRMRVESGLERRIRGVVEMTTRISGGPATAPHELKTPPMEMLLSLAVVEVDPSGTATLTVRFDDMGVVEGDGAEPHPAAAAMEAALDMMTNLRMTFVVDARGCPQSVEIIGLEGLPPMVAQQMDSVKQTVDQICTPVPEEPVGIGARWEVNATLDSGVRMEQRSVYELVRRDSDGLTLRVDVQVSAAPQEIHIGGQATGMRLEELAGSGGGETTLDARTLFPRQADMRMKMKMSQSLPAGDDAPNARLEMTMHMTMNQVD